MATRFQIYKQAIADLARAAAELDQVHASLKDTRLHDVTTDRLELNRVSTEADIRDLVFMADGLLKELRTAECEECGHAISKHGDRYGCEYERGDVEMPTRDGGTILAAAGPCHCQWGLEEPKA